MYKERDEEHTSIIGSHRLAWKFRDFMKVWKKYHESVQKTNLIKALKYMNFYYFMWNFILFVDKIVVFIW